MATLTKGNFITEIFEHDISWYVDSHKVTELRDGDVQYIEESIAKGFTSGQLCIPYGKNNNKEATGWWNLINWKNIALELYNSMGNTEQMKKARQLFDDNWGLK